MYCNKYRISKKNFNYMYRMSQEIYGNISIIKSFCNGYKDVDDFYKILPLIKYTDKLSDKLYSEFINMK